MTSRDVLTSRWQWWIMDVGMTTRGQDRSGMVYEILVRGCLGDDIGDELGCSRLEQRDGRTLIVIDIIDQSHLHGVIERLRDLNIEIESVNRA
jgi:hypothetical protein